jgi:predicted DNA-binding protein with PD1-like motif
VRTKLLHEHEDQRTFVLALDAGDEVTESMLSFSGENRISNPATALALLDCRSTRRMP